MSDRDEAESREEAIIASWRKVADEWMARATKAEADLSALQEYCRQSGTGLTRAEELLGAEVLKNRTAKARATAVESEAMRAREELRAADARIAALCEAHEKACVERDHWRCGFDLEANAHARLEAYLAADKEELADAKDALSRQEATLEEYRIAQQVSDEVVGNLREQLATVEADLAVNAKLLSHQMDLARQAEIERDEARADLAKERRV